MRNVLNLKSSLYASLAALTLTGGVSTADAGDYELWREQVNTEASATSKVEVSIADSAATSDNRFWREQVSGNGKLPSIVAKSDSSVPDYALWREQIEIGGRSSKQKVAAK